MTKAAELAKMGEVLTNSQIGGRRNLIINGGMQIAQRGTSQANVGSTTSGFHTLDRFKHFSDGSSAGRLTMSQSTVSDLPGFVNALKLDCTTADTSIDAGEYFILSHPLEGQDLQQLKKGTSSAEKVTLSFYVKGNASATYSLELNDGSRRIGQTFSVTTSWNRVVLTFDGDTSGAIDDDNTVGLYVNFWLHAGTNFSGGTHGTSWATVANNERAGNSTSIFDSTDRTLEITGFQMEVGSQATPFEHRSFGEELGLCQRYFQKSGEYSIAPSNGSDTSSFSSFAEALGTCVHWGGSTAGVCPIYLPVRMRATPTLVKYGNSNGYLGYISSGSSAPSADNVLAFHQYLYLSPYTEQMIAINNQVTGDTVWGVMGGFTADSEL